MALGPLATDGASVGDATGVGVGLGVALGLGVAEGRGVAEAVAVGDAEGRGVAEAVAVGDAEGRGVAEAVAVGDADAAAVGVVVGAAVEVPLGVGATVFAVPPEPLQPAIATNEASSTTPAATDDRAVRMRWRTFKGVSCEGACRTILRQNGPGALWGDTLLFEMACTSHRQHKRRRIPNLLPVCV